jgi:hypothetical protein
VATSATISLSVGGKDSVEDGTKVGGARSAAWSRRQNREAIQGHAASVSRRRIELLVVRPLWLKSALFQNCPLRAVAPLIGLAFLLVQY